MRSSSSSAVGQDSPPARSASNSLPLRTRPTCGVCRMHGWCSAWTTRRARWSGLIMTPPRRPLTGLEESSIRLRRVRIPACASVMFMSLICPKGLWTCFRIPPVSGFGIWYNTRHEIVSIGRFSLFNHHRGGLPDGEGDGEVADVEGVAGSLHPALAEILVILVHRVVDEDAQGVPRAHGGGVHDV